MNKLLPPYALFDVTRFAAFGQSIGRHFKISVDTLILTQHSGEVSMGFLIASWCHTTVYTCSYNYTVNTLIYVINLKLYVEEGSSKTNRVEAKKQPNTLIKCKCSNKHKCFILDTELIWNPTPTKYDLYLELRAFHRKLHCISTHRYLLL